MKRGHVTGERVEKPGAGDWYRAREEELIQQVERAQAVQVRPEDSAASLHGHRNATTVRYTIILKGTAVRVRLTAASAAQAWRQYRALWAGATPPARKNYSIQREVAP
jgi:hypothetical protein